MRHFRGSRRRTISPVTQSFKKVLNEAPASVSAGTNVFTLVNGVDSIPAGQTTVTDAQVPTGSQVRFIEIQHAVGNLAESAAFVHVAIEMILADQSVIPANTVGGSNKRNQVFLQAMFQMGHDQSNSRTYKFKIPRKYWRIREGMTWQFIWTNDATVSSAIQAIYKFYR